MPIVSRSSTRVLPPNARTADVARETLNRAIPIQNRKTDAAFQVNGYTGVLYSYLTSGTKCACQSRKSTIASRLDDSGNASSHDINSLLTGGAFGVRPYAERHKFTDSYKEQAASQKPSVLTVRLGPNAAPPVALASLFDMDDVDDRDTDRDTNGLPDRVDTTGDNPRASLQIDSDPSQEVASLLGDFDASLLGHSDIACPVCFGSGFIGGYAILHGYRKVLNFQTENSVLPDFAVIAMEKDVPTVTTTSASWSFVFPAGCAGVDAFRIWNNLDQVFNFVASIDGIPLLKQADIARFCDGRDHLLSVAFNENTEFSHLELQINQSEFSANFELPKLSKSSTQSIREAVDPFQIFLSPRVPMVKALDVIVESTYGKALQVKTVTGLNDKHYSTMGWEVDVRPTQPQELFFMLPRRKMLASINTPRMTLSTKQTT